MINTAFKKFAEFTEELFADGYHLFFTTSDSTMDGTDDDFSPVSYNGLVTIFVVKSDEDDEVEIDEDDESNLILLSGDAVFSQSISTYSLIGSVAEQNLADLTALIRSAVLHDKTITEFKATVFPDGVTFDIAGD